MKDSAFAEAKAAMAELSRLVRHPFDPTESG
jgi:hypothetical protein